MSDTHLLLPLSPAEARHIDQTCDRFEAAWKAGARPHLVEYLGAAGEPERSALLRQLLLLDWEYRRRAGEDPRADYHARFPTDTALIEDVAREMAESANSTHLGSDGAHGQDTPWFGHGAPVQVDDAAAGAAAGSARYDLLQEVGRGGIGVVFRGRDRHLGRELAVKVLREAYRDRADARRRFIAEARVGSQLQHPAIVPVYELGSFADGQPYLTMKLVEGHTLTVLLKDRADPNQDLPRFLGIFEQVCQAMAYAHAQGVIHRDLKPANIMVGAFGEVQVMDWGFAKQLPKAEIPDEFFEKRVELPATTSGNSTEATQSGALMGTPSYMPPEQAQGEAALIDHRADVFALGAILCEILTGRPPYVGDSAEEICRNAAAGDLEDARASLDACGADEALRELAKRCLESERSSRPSDAGIVAKDLTAYLASAQERLRQAQLERVAADARAQEAGAKARAERHARRLTLALAVAAVVLLALVGSGWWWRQRLQQAEVARRATLADQARDSLNAARTLIAENKLTAAREKLAQARAQLGEDPSALGNLAVEVAAGEAELDRFQQFLDLIDRAHQAETAPLLGRTIEAKSADGTEGMAVPATTGRLAAAAVQFLLEALQRYEVLARDDWNSALEGGLLAQQQVEQIRRLVYEELLWLADDVVHRRQEHGSTRILSPGGAAKQALLYLSNAETAHRPTRALYELRARCRKSLGDETAAQAETQRAGKTPATVAWDYYLQGQAAFDAKHLPEGVQAFEAALRLEPTHYWSLMWLGYCLCDLGRGPEDFTGAARVFTGCILKRPDHAHAYYCRANAYSKLHRGEQALADRSKAIDLDPKLAYAWYSRGVTYNELGQPVKALHDFSKAIDLDPKDARAWINRGVTHYKLRQPDKALADYSQAIALDSKIALAWNNRSASYNDLGQPEKALSDCARAIELDSKDARPWISRGTAHHKLRQPDKAFADYCKAIELDPNSALAWNTRGWFLNELGQPDKALSDCSRAIELDPGSAQAWNTRGGAHFKLSQTEKAIADYSKAIELDPKLALAWNNRGWAYNTMNQRAKAVADCSQAIELDPKLALAWFNRGVIHFQWDRPEQAVADFTKAIELDPKDAMAWDNRGNSYLKLRQPDKALADCSHAIELDPKYARAWLNRGAAHVRLSQPHKAIADFSEVIKLEPTSASAWFNRGVVHADLGQSDKAVTDFSKAIELAPNNPQLVEAYLGRALAHDRLAHFEQARTDYQTFLKRVPAHKGALNALAWLLATCPDAKLRDPSKAVESAKKAVKLSPKEGNYWKTLGVAHFRAGDWSAAVAALDKSRELRQGGDAVDQFFLAMAYRKLGNDDEASKAYQQALEWLQRNKDTLEKDKTRAEAIRLFRTEAEGVLDLQKK